MFNALPVSLHMTHVAYAVGDDQSLAEAALRMKQLGIRHLPVMRGSRLVGILSHRDVALLKATANASLSELSVSDAMTPDPYTVAPDQSLSEVTATMFRNRYGAAIVVHDGEIVGIFTSTDAMWALSRLTA